MKLVQKKETYKNAFSSLQNYLNVGIDNIILKLYQGNNNY